MEQPEFDDLFNVIGWGFPENPDELDCFEKVHENYTFNFNVDSINADRIIATVKKTQIKITQIDYHKRTVLAAEIVFRLKSEWSMGHLKLQKLLYLCQNALNMPIHANFLKQTMGPYDPILMRSLDKQFKQHKWFEFKKDLFPKYQLLENAGGHNEWYQRYFHDQISRIEFIVETFRSTKTAQIELIATIYACWLEILESKEEWSEQSIIERVYAWSAHKAKFSEKEILDTITLMRDKNIFPQASIL